MVSVNENIEERETRRELAKEDDSGQSRVALASAQTKEARAYRVQKPRGELRTVVTANLPMAGGHGVSYGLAL
jgi:hypothetical protein